MSASLMVQGVAFKPLVLERDGGPGAGDHFEKKTPFGVYRVWAGRGSEQVHASLMFNHTISSPGMRLYGADGRSPTTIEEGMALAQADYARRVAELLAPAEAVPKEDWLICLSDPRDVARLCSVLTGAAYTSAEDAMKRINNKTAWGISLLGTVRVEAPAPVKTDHQGPAG